MELLDSTNQEDSSVEKSKTEYKEIFVKDYEEAVNSIERANEFRKEQTFNFCLQDVDGVLLDNTQKAPILSHIIQPQLTNETKESFNKLASVTNGHLAISTNRSQNPKLFFRLLFNTKGVVRTVEMLTGDKVPRFTGLFKQAPSLARENIANIEDWSKDKVIRARTDALVHYIGKLATERDYKRYNLTSIEDWCFASLNRKTFLMYVSNKLKLEYGIDIERIDNYVIKK